MTEITLHYVPIHAACTLETWIDCKQKHNSVKNSDHNNMFSHDVSKKIQSVFLSSHVSLRHKQKCFSQEVAESRTRRVKILIGHKRHGDNGSVTGDWEEGRTTAGDGGLQHHL